MKQNKDNADSTKKANLRKLESTFLFFLFVRRIDLLSMLVTVAPFLIIWKLNVYSQFVTNIFMAWKISRIFNYKYCLQLIKENLTSNRVLTMIKSSTNFQSERLHSKSR